MTAGIRAKIVLMLAGGLLAAVGIGAATHLIARDTVGLSAARLDPAGPLAPPAATVGTRDSQTTRLTGTDRRVDRRAAGSTVDDDGRNRRRRSRGSGSDERGSATTVDSSGSEDRGSSNSGRGSGDSGGDDSGRGRGRGRGGDD